MESPEKKNIVLVVDDVADNRRLLANIISTNTDCRVLTASEGSAIFEIIDSDLPDLILLDIMMPVMDGYKVAKLLSKEKKTRHIPIIFITAKTDVESKVEAFNLGGVDYITKPFHKEELLARVNAQLRLKNLQDELKLKNKMLEDKEVHLIHLVEEKTQKIERVTLSLVTVLEDANLANDDDTGNHIKRVNEYSALLAKKCGMDREFVERIRIYASLHDVGKVGIPDAILKKPGKYTQEEFEQMKQHVVIGGRMLDNAEIDQMARNISLYHHEKWDGSGYCNGLKQEDIPIESRFVALADVYDALLTKRVYKEAFPREKAERIIYEGRGKHFDPDIVDSFFKISGEMYDIWASLK